MTARENAETADLTLEVRSLKEQLAESEKKCQALTVESEGWARQMEEATGLLERWRLLAGDQAYGVNIDTKAFLSRAPAQAAEPMPMLRRRGNVCEPDCASLRCPAKHPAHIAAESKLAAVRRGYESILATSEDMLAIRGEDCTVSLRATVVDLQEFIGALLAPSQGEGGGGNG